MKNNKLGCLTSTGIFAALITLIVIVVAIFISGAQMFSAGPLNAQAGDAMGGVTAHAAIGECSACHAAPWDAGIMADRCMQCHQDISAQLFHTDELHSVIAQNNPGLGCRECHPEHRGASAALTDLSENSFPHDALGFSLNGHQTTVARKSFVCSDCHAGDSYKFEISTCDTCHRDMDVTFTESHVTAYGSNCLGCHDGVDRYGKDFSHAMFSFSLDGKHANLDCAQCHTNAHSAADLQSTPTECSSCHQKDDPHAGAYGAACGVCHNPEAWTPAKFDHNLAAFKLEGGHTDVACEKCHINNVFKGTPSTCNDCHQKDDEHNGQNGTDCSACHNTKNWDDVESFDHNSVNFPLNGGHGDVQCDQCHKGGVFTGLSTTCSTCHADPDFHAGAFSGDCSSCHTISGWTPAQFDLSHREPRAEEGGNGINHGGATCRQCHPSTVNEATCTACHEGGFEGGDDDDDD